MNRYSSRKFLLTVGVQVVASLALFTSHLTGGEWVAVSTLTLGVYGGANVMHAKETSK